MSETVMAPPLPDAPYRGIEPFRFTDQQIFAARGEETWALLSNVTLYRAVLLYGESGTGKSSLVNAGLLPQVLKENYVPDRLRVQPFAGREIKVERIRISGAGDQATYLPSNFARPELSGSAENIELSLADFRARLEEFRPAAAAKGESGALFDAPRSTPRPLLIFDQFEEFITLFEEAQRVGTTEETGRAREQVPTSQQDILATLVELIQDETLPIKIIFSFRDDYLAKLSLLFDHCPELLDQAQRLLPPGIEALAQIIRAPFTDPELRTHFLKQKAGAGSELSEDLAQRIAGELGRRSKGDTANLTELQIVCQRLWHEADPEKLFSEHGIEGILKGYGADVFRNFTPEQRDAAVVLLSHMVTASNTRNIISEEDLLSRTAERNFQPAQSSDALSALARSQIVRREPRHSIYFYEITSEYLVPWIKEQVAERKSAEERRLAEAAQQKLEAERAEAVQQFEAEKHRALVFKRVLAAMFVLLVISVGLGVYAFWLRQRAKKAEYKAQDLEQQTKKILQALTLVASQKPDENLEGIAQFDTLVKDGRISPDLASVVLQPVLASQDKRVHQAGYDLLLRTEQTNPNVAQSVLKAAETNTALAEKIPPRFFIHISDESQRGQAKQLAGILKKQGYLVPGIENVGARAPRNNQLRYSRESDPGIPTLPEIVTVLNQANLGRWTTLRIPGNEKSTKIGQFELWFGNTPAAPPDSNSTDGNLVMIFVTTDGAPPSSYPVGTIIVKDSSGKPLLTKSLARQIGTPLKVTLKEDTYTVLVDAQGDRPQTRRVILKAGETTSLMFNVRPDTRGPQQQTSPTPYQFVDPADQKKQRP